MSNTQFVIVLCAILATCAFIVACLLPSYRDRIAAKSSPAPQPATDHTHTRDDNTARLVAIAELLLIHQIARTDPDAARIVASRAMLRDTTDKKSPPLPEEIRDYLVTQYRELARVERENEAADLGNPNEPERKPRGTILAGFGPL